ncbi:MAG: PTS sugar transporter subunit IIA [Bifidobacterium sp.]|uniref:PTS sugar transporter subunit IIA n=1 Tax=Bifidobacterium sp. TaxID=41200 RepID=UPI0039EB1F2B
MLSQFFRPGSILYREGVAGWQEAVDAVTLPLIGLGTIRPTYVQAIKDSIAGPGGTYIDLGSGIALAHARPENGVVDTSLSVLHVASPFLLADQKDHAISTIFCLAAKDATTHIDLMRSLANFLGNEADQRKLAAVSNEEQLIQIFADHE